MTQNEKIPVRSEKTAFRVIDGEVVIVLLEKNLTLVLNEVGSRIWENIDGRKDIEEIARGIASEFDGSFDGVYKDTFEFMDELCGRGALSFSGGI